MLFIENPIRFFDRIEYLADKLVDYMRKRDEDGDAGFLIFKTPSFTTNKDGEEEPFIRSLCATLTEEDESDDDMIEILDFFHLCQFSVDNVNYYDYVYAKDNETIRDILSQDPKTENYELYLRDITGTIYTIIKPESRGYLEYIYRLRRIEKEVYDEGYSNNKTIKYYHNLTVAFYVFNNRFKLGIDPETISPITYFRMNEEDDSVVWDLEELSINDIIHDMGYIGSEKPEFPDLVSRVQTTQTNYSDFFKSGNVSFDLFGKSFSYSFDKAKLPMGVITELIKYLFTEDKYTPKGKNNIFDLMVKNTIAETNLFNADRFGEKLEKIIEEYAVTFSLMRTKLRDVCMYTPNTYLMCAVYSDASNSGIFDKYVLGPRHFFEEGMTELIQELSTLQYIDQFIIAVEDFVEEVKGYREDVDSFGDDVEFYGGGRGIRGGIGGALAATFLSAASQTIYSAYKASKIDVDKFESVYKEFMVTDASQEFFKVLIETDFVYLMIKLISLLNMALKETDIFFKYESHIDYKELFDAFGKAYKIYNIALAKHLKLSFLPSYKGFESYKKKKPVELMQEVLLQFPYYYKFYEKYIELGGEMSEELVKYAAAHLVDISYLYEKEKERIEKKKQEEKEKGAKAAERKRAKEEKRKAEEERIKSELLSLSPVYGELPSEYPDLFRLLIDNPIFLENKEKEITDHIMIADDVFRYLTSAYPGNPNTNIISGRSEKFNNKKHNIMKVYGYDKIKDYNVLLYFDVTIMGSGKEGYVITTDNICVRNSFEQPYAIPIKSIKKLTVKDKILTINGKYKIDAKVSCVKEADITSVFVYIICNLLLLAKNGYKPDIPEADTPSGESAAKPVESLVGSATVKLKSIFGKITSALETSTPAPKTWTCSCGKNNSLQFEFCPHCGSKQPQTGADWYCGACGQKNKSEANFCSKCGTKKSV